ncbi:MAG: hypothetical protein P4L84_28570 [Isosphaeraceae bacterium]|nr:hypothetical protein [Isosphaeraceae bacterium]
MTGVAERPINVKVPCNVPVYIASLLAAQAGMLAWSATRHSPSVDEVAHMAAGISRWHLGRFDIYRVNPPLASTVAALPVVLARPRVNWEGLGMEVRPEWRIGMHFVHANGLKTFWYFSLARWGCIPLILLGGYFCYRWGAELWGPASGLVALALWVFSPTVLGNAAMITADATGAAMGVLAHYLLWCWLRAPSWRGAFLAGLALGLVELSKTTWIILFALWPLLWAVCRFPEWRTLAAGGERRQAGQLLLILLIGLYVLNAGYGFTGTFRRLDRFAFHCRALAGPMSPGQYTGNRFAGTWAGAVWVPLPADYVLGIDLQKWDYERKMWSFLRGEYRVGGWWYYYLYAFVVKEPLGTLCLALLAAGLACGLRGEYVAGWRDELAVILPAVAVFALVSSQTGFNRYYRYVLPALPLFYIATSRVGRALTSRRWPIAYAAGLALAWSVGSSLMVFPHSMSYFNELAGGPEGGHYHLIDANIEWGQDLLYLKRWAEDHPQARPLFVDVNGPLEPEHLAMPARVPSGQRVAGWYAIGVHKLHDIEGGYRDLLDRRPDAMIGYSIYIYHLSAEDLARTKPSPRMSTSSGTGKRIAP